MGKFHYYLYGARFMVRTDNSLLIYILTAAKLNATGHRWLAALSTYNFSVQFTPGKSNTEADALSCNGFFNKKTRRQGRNTTLRHQNNLQNVIIQKCVKQLGVSSEDLPECYAFPTRLDIDSLAIELPRFN